MRAVLALALLLVLQPKLAISAEEAAVGGVVPVRVTIARMGLDAPVIRLGLEEDGAMAAPSDPDTVGWYELGPGLGVAGNAVLAGHVDWGGQLRTFGLLKRLEPDDLVTVYDEHETAFTYRVLWSRLYEDATAPVEEIFAQSWAEELTLITCGGAFDPSSRQYLSRLVVRALRVYE